jgi:hypothetical protein
LQSYVLDLELMTTEFLEPLLALPAISCERARALVCALSVSRAGTSILLTLHQCVAQLVPLHRTLVGALEEAMRKWPVSNIARPLSVRARAVRVQSSMFLLSRRV